METWPARALPQLPSTLWGLQMQPSLLLSTEPGPLGQPGSHLPCGGRSILPQPPALGSMWGTPFLHTEEGSGPICRPRSRLQGHAGPRRATQGPTLGAVVLERPPDTQLARPLPLITGVPIEGGRASDPGCSISGSPHLRPPRVWAWVAVCPH